MHAAYRGHLPDQDDDWARPEDDAPVPCVNVALCGCEAWDLEWRLCWGCAAIVEDFSPHEFARWYVACLDREPAHVGA